MRGNPFAAAAAAAETRSSNPFATDADGCSSEDESMNLLVSNVSRRGRWIGELGEAVDPEEDESYMYNGTALFITTTLFASCFLAQELLAENLARIGEDFAIEVQQAFGQSDQLRTFVDVTGPGPTPVIFYLSSIMLWCGESTFGKTLPRRLLFLNAIGMVLKWTLNQLLHVGRPFWQNKNIAMLHCPTSYGSPSGHAMLWLLFLWPIMRFVAQGKKDETTRTSTERYFRRTYQVQPKSNRCRRLCSLLGKAILIQTIALLYINMIWFRVYLGTHYFFDVIFGTVTATFLLSVFTRHNVAVLNRSLPTCVVSGNEDVYCYKRVLRVAWVTITLTVIGMVLSAWCGIVVWTTYSPGNPRKDPAVWSTRAKHGCGVEPDTLDAAYAAKGVGMIFGWIVAISIIGQQESLGNFCCGSWCASSWFDVQRNRTVGITRVLCGAFAFGFHLLKCVGLLLVCTELIPWLISIGCENISSSQDDFKGLANNKQSGNDCFARNWTGNGIGYFAAMLAMMLWAPYSMSDSVPTGDNLRKYQAYGSGALYVPVEHPVLVTRKSIR